MPIVAGTRISRGHTLELAAMLARDGSDHTARVLLDAVTLAREFVASRPMTARPFSRCWITRAASSSNCGPRSSPNSTGVEASPAARSLEAGLHTFDEHRGKPNAGSRSSRSPGARG